MSKFMLAHRTDVGVLQRTDVVGEKKLDGTRCHIIKTPTSLEMWSRDGKTNEYKVNYAKVHNLPEVEHDLNILKCKSVWLDVEMCWFNSVGRSIMRGSQARCGTKKPQAVQEKMALYPINACAFDLLELNGEDFTRQPFIVRKAMLEELLQQLDLRSLQYVGFTTEKRELWNLMVSMGAEGIMCKTLMHTYEFRRSRSWLKLKYEKITDGKAGRPPPRKVVGYTYGKNARARFFGSLVMQNEDGSYGGNVGGGFDTEELEWWKKVLESSPRIAKPFPDKIVGETYIPVKVPFRVMVRYLEVTANGVLRMPVYVSYVQ